MQLTSYSSSSCTFAGLPRFPFGSASGSDSSSSASSTSESGSGTFFLPLPLAGEDFLFFFGDAFVIFFLAFFFGDLELFFFGVALDANGSKSDPSSSDAFNASKSGSSTSFALPKLSESDISRFSTTFRLFGRGTFRN